MYKSDMTSLRRASPARSSRLSVAFVLRPHFSLTALAGVIDTLRLAADEGATDRLVRCGWTLVGRDLLPLTSSSGIPIAPSELYGDPARFDAVVVVAGLIEREPPLDAETLAFIRSADAAGKLIAGVGTGVLPLIQAGLLDGRSCCVHWYRYRDFVDRFPKVRFRTDQVVLADGRYITCAGTLSAAQLGVWLVRKYHGDALAQKCVDLLLIQGKVAQPHPPAPGLGTSERVRRTMLILEENAARPLVIESIAQKLGVSARQLQRVFKEEIGVTLQAYSRGLRLHYGLWQIHVVGMSIAEASAACGFTDAAHFSRVCLQAYQKRPLAFTRQEVEGIAERFGHRAARLRKVRPAIGARRAARRGTEGR